MVKVWFSVSCCEITPPPPPKKKKHTQSCRCCCFDRSSNVFSPAWVLRSDPWGMSLGFFLIPCSVGEYVYLYMLHVCIYVYVCCIFLIIFRLICTLYFYLYSYICMYVDISTCIFVCKPIFTFACICIHIYSFTIKCQLQNKKASNRWWSVVSSVDLSVERSYWNWPFITWVGKKSTILGDQTMQMYTPED